MPEDDKKDSFRRATFALVLHIKEMYTDGAITLADVPDILIEGMRFLSSYKAISGKNKRTALIIVLMEVCPFDQIDEIIPPFIDAIWPVLKKTLPGTKSKCVSFCFPPCSIL